MAPQAKVGIAAVVITVLLGAVFLASRGTGNKSTTQPQKLDEKPVDKTKTAKPATPANSNTRTATPRNDNSNRAAAPRPNTNANTAATHSPVTPPRRGDVAMSNANTNTAGTPPIANANTATHRPLVVNPERSEPPQSNANSRGEPVRSAETTPPVANANANEPPPPTSGPKPAPTGDVTVPVLPDSGSTTLSPAPFAAPRSDNANSNSAVVRESTSNANANSARSSTGSPGVATPPRGATTPPGRETTPPKPTGAPEASRGEKYTIKAGDNLSKIAREHYGSDKYWAKIREANPTVNPDKLSVGQVISLPSKESVTGKPETAKPSTGGPAGRETGSPDSRLERTPPKPPAGSTSGAAGTPSTATPGAGAAPPAADRGAKPTTAKPTGAADTGAAKSDAVKPATETKSYVVEQGDSLKVIAQKVLKNPKRWREIYDLNKDKIKDPNRLFVGTPLTVPASAAVAPASSKKPTTNGATPPAAKPSTRSSPTTRPNTAPAGRTTTSATKPAAKPGASATKAPTTRPGTARPRTVPNR